MGVVLADIAAVFEVLHMLALRGSLPQLPSDLAGDLEAAGLVRPRGARYALTDDGHRLHRALAEQERMSLDLKRLDVIFEAFVPVNRSLTVLLSHWQAADDKGSDELIGELRETVARVRSTLRRSAEVAPRFETYIARLAEAMRSVEGGETEFAFSPEVESVHTVCRDLHEDYLQTLGRGPELDPGAA